jgi:hypothetical protein
MFGTAMCHKIKCVHVASGIIFLDYHYDMCKRIPDVKISQVPCRNEGAEVVHKLDTYSFRLPILFL